MTFDKDFKDAISLLSSTEKDKLILRLLKRDKTLANRLYFELVSDDSKEDRREKVMEEIGNIIAISKKNCSYSTPGIMFVHARSANGIIKEHVQITKDKYGEVFLHLFVVKEYLKIYNDYFSASQPSSAYTFNIYMVAKLFKIMILIRKMHEDDLIDFTDDLREAGDLIGKNPTGIMKVAVLNGLDINWLIGGNIPANIAEIEKDLRQRGFLK